VVQHAADAQQIRANPAESLWIGTVSLPGAASPGQPAADAAGQIEAMPVRLSGQGVARSTAREGLHLQNHRRNSDRQSNRRHWPPSPGLPTPNATKQEE